MPSQPRPQLRLQRPLGPFLTRPRAYTVNPRAYTMVELLTVIAIIAIISGIIVLSLGRVGASRQQNQTVVLLSRLNSAMTDITNSSDGSHKLFTIQLPGIYFPGANGSYDHTTYPGMNWIGVPAGAVESQIRTALVLKQIISSSPAGKQILTELPPERRKELTWDVTDAQVPGSKLLMDAPTKPKPHYTMPLDSWGNPIIFVYDNLQIGTGTNVGRPFTVALNAAAETEVGGALNMYSVSDKSYYEPPVPLAPAPVDSMMTAIDSPNPQQMYMASTSVPARSTYTPHRNPADQTKTDYTFRSPDHRPFWMSAGPDGKYETIDDNVFSFGN